MSAALRPTELDAEPKLDDALARLRRGLHRAEPRQIKGRVTQALGVVIRAVVPQVRLGELCRLYDPQTGQELHAEVVGLQEGEAILTPIGRLRHLSSRAEVIPLRQSLSAPVGAGLLGRVVDGLGAPIDDLGPLCDVRLQPVDRDPPAPMSRGLIERPLPVGVRAIDALLTCGEGQRLGIFGPPGTGKSTLLAQLTKNADADVVVIGLIGERGREVREFVARELDEAGRARSVIIVATSDRPAMERLKAAYLATTIAEGFRDEGKRVLLLMDSVTRFARAAREVGLASGEPPARRGFPPSVFAELPQLLERTGPGAVGSITAFYTVLVEGDERSDPIAEEVRAILDGHIMLSPDLAASEHYPAIDVLASRSRVMDAVVERAQRHDAARLRTLLARYQEVELLLQVGEYQAGGDALADEAVSKIDAIRHFLRQAPDEPAEFTATYGQLHGLVSAEAT